MRTRKKGRLGRGDDTPFSLLWLFLAFLCFHNGVVVITLGQVTSNPGDDDASEADSTAPTTNLCRLENGLSSIIVDIEESVGDETGQTTTPKELPIIGDPWNQIDLTLVQHDKRYFRLHGKKLQLSQPLDRDEDDISSIVFQAVCVVKSTKESRTIPVIARVSDKNDNSPKFVGEPYEISIPESTPVGTTVFRGIRAQDVDAGVNGLVEYSVLDSKGDRDDEDGYGIFTINLPHQGAVTLNRTLDYERSQRYYVTIVASTSLSVYPSRPEMISTF